MAVDYHREEVTTTVVRYRIKTPALWADVHQLMVRVRNELAGVHAGGHGLSRDAIRDWVPADDQMWVEPLDDEIAVCYQKESTRRG